MEQAVLPGAGHGVTRDSWLGSNAASLTLPGLNSPGPSNQPAEVEMLTFSRPHLKRFVSSPQANLAFDPAALLPGASPKSPGLKAVVSPFHSPPSTPSSPGVRSRAGEPEEVPVSFDQPPEGSHLPCYNKVASGPHVLGSVCGNLGTGQSQIISALLAWSRRMHLSCNQSRLLTEGNFSSSLQVLRSALSLPASLFSPCNCH